MAQAVPKDFDPEKADNNPEIEAQWAVQAARHLETYWKILEKVRGSTLRLTRLDDGIYAHLRRDFPDLDVGKPIDEDGMKSADGKRRWRDFMMEYEHMVEDFNYGTILRVSPKTEYTQEGTIFVPRMQFYAIEIARNKEGLNDWIYEKNQTRKEEGG